MIEEKCYKNIHISSNLLKKEKICLFFTRREVFHVLVKLNQRILCFFNLPVESINMISYEIPKKEPKISCKFWVKVFLFQINKIRIILRNLFDERFTLRNTISKPFVGKHFMPADTIFWVEGEHLINKILSVVRNVLVSINELSLVYKSFEFFDTSIIHWQKGWTAFQHFKNHATN